MPTPTPTPTLANAPLAGLTIALDPGHNIGNSLHIKEINRKLWVGLWKICNTAGTETDSGYAEANYNFDVALRARARLEELGAQIVMTRTTNSVGEYGPCIDFRGRFGKAEGAVLKVSIHADGAPKSGHGFHIIAPANYAGYTDDIYRASGKLARAMVVGMTAAGLTESTYISGAINVRKDQGTLNMSDIPTVIVETLNMRNAADAEMAASPGGRQQVADALVGGIRAFLGR